jgi:hypothetical protein
MMKLLILSLSLFFFAALPAFAASVSDAQRECVAKELAAQIRLESGTNFKVVGQFDESVQLLDLIVEITFPDGISSRGIVVIKNGDYTHSVFTVSGLNPQPLKLDSCF